MKSQRDNFESWIRPLFPINLPAGVCYHNLDHTLLVVEKSQKIGWEEKLSDESMEDLFYSAWLHDVGYWEGVAAGHEEVGARFAQDHLPDWGLDQYRIDRIKSAILATKVPQSPQNELEAVLCDADMYHLSLGDFIESSLVLKEEIENLLSIHWSKLDWLKNSRDFTMSHRFKTRFGRIQLEPLKQQNIALLEHEIRKLESEN